MRKGKEEERKRKGEEKGGNAHDKVAMSRARHCKEKIPSDERN